MGYRSDIIEEIAVVGQPIFQHYYVIMDFNKNRVALSGYRYKNEPKELPIKGWMVFIISAMLLTGVLIGFKYVLDQKRRQLDKQL
jgi:hypothetical protein